MLFLKMCLFGHRLIAAFDSRVSRRHWIDSHSSFFISHLNVLSEPSVSHLSTSKSRYNCSPPAPPDRVRPAFSTLHSCCVHTSTTSSYKMCVQMILSHKSLDVHLIILLLIAVSLADCSRRWQGLQVLCHPLDNLCLCLCLAALLKRPCRGCCTHDPCEGNIKAPL